VLSAPQVAPAAQSVASAQGAALHAPTPHAYGAQLVVAPATQAPAPLHFDAAVSIEVVASHVAAAPHAVPAAMKAHAPLPSQVPSVPQVAAAIVMQVARGSAPPLSTGWQLPALPETAHEEQAGQLASPQQTCSTQWPLMHVVPSVQAPPFLVRFVHEPFAHEYPAAVAQSPSPPQVVRQAAPAPHMYPLQPTGVCLHVPAPLQKPSGVSVASAHDAVPQDVVLEAFLQAPPPSHVPTKPQGGLAAQRPCGSAASEGTSAQVPSWPITLHAWHVPHDGLAQHTPSTHASTERQSSSIVQDSPSRCLSPHLFLPRSQMAGDAQSPSPRQVAPQSVPLHMYGAHDWVPACLHVPAPSQARPSVSVDPVAGHVGGAHGVPAAYRSHAPLPSQKPVVSQLAAPAFVHVFVGSVPPTGTGVQVPAVAASAHDRHVPVQAVLQQTLCAQKPLAHSAPSAQVAPGDLRPHEPFVHIAGGPQSASAVQLALQAEAPQRNGKHELAAGVTHAPAPSHVEPGVNVVVLAGQLGSPQGVPCPNFWQAPAAHMPFVPHVDAPCATQVFEGSGAPVATSPHVPIAPCSAHDLHAPAQAVEQHTPCAQKPEPHSDAVEQNAPMGFAPHEVAVQTLGETHWASAVHRSKHRAPLQAKGAHGMADGATHWPVLLHVEAGV